jgi:hypothetical protein
MKIEYEALVSTPLLVAYIPGIRVLTLRGAAMDKFCGFNDTVYVGVDIFSRL